MIPLKTMVSACSPAKWAGLAAVGGAALLTLLAAAFPDDHWASASPESTYRPPPGRFRPLLVWSTNEGERYAASFNVVTYAFPGPSPPVVIPIEGRRQSWMGPRFVDGSGKILIEGPRYGRFTEEGRGTLLELASGCDRIVFDDEGALKAVLERIPELARIDAREKFVDYRWGGRGVPLAFEIPPVEWGLIFLRLSGFLAALLLGTSALRALLFGGDASMTAWALSAAASGGSLILVLWMFAELGILHPAVALGGFAAAAAAIRLRRGGGPDRLEWDGVDRASLCVLLLACFGLMFSGAFRWNGDMGRYLQQARILEHFSGWNRDYLGSLSGENNLRNYPFALGLFYHGVFRLAGVSSGEWLHPGARLSVALVLSKALFGLLHAVVLVPVLRREGKGDRLPSLGLVAVCLLLPSFRGSSIGGENLLWPLLAGLFAVLWLPLGLGPGGRRALAFILAAAAGLTKSESLILVAALVLPALLAGGWLRGDLRESAILGGWVAVGLAPLAAFLLLNRLHGFTNTVYLPLTVENLRAGWQDLYLILRLQLGHAINAAIPILIALTLPAVSAWRGAALKPWLKRAGTLLSIGLAYVLVIAGVYLLSDYPSRGLHVEQSFDRLFSPLPVLWAACLVRP